MMRGLSIARHFGAGVDEDVVLLKNRGISVSHRHAYPPAGIAPLPARIETNVRQPNPLPLPP